MAKLKSPDAGPDTGSEVAVNVEMPVIGATAGPVESAGPVKRYSVVQRCDPAGVAVVVESPDGTIEDAVRAFNARRGGEIRTAKQLILTPL